MKVIQIRFRVKEPAMGQGEKSISVLGFRTDEVNSSLRKPKSRKSRYNIEMKTQLRIALFFVVAFFPMVERRVVVGDESSKPNVLFISMDDLNDWIGCMGGHPQAKTPNIDRLAAAGMLFTNAHCPAPACNPSRTAVMTGIPAFKSGLYDNRQKMRKQLPDAELIPKYFSRNGYWSAGSGKLLHYFIDADSWDEYYPRKETENPFPRTLYPETRPLNLPVGGPWQYKETDWGPLDATNEEYGGDWLVSKWIGEQLSRKHDKPFFLACGIYRPHEPWFVPKKYFEDYPLESIQLPLGYKKDDLDDLPAAGQQMGPNRYFAHIQDQGQWKKAIQGYLASIAFADDMVGRVLDALEKGPNRDNTIVVLWSDHGWHLGEKQHWQKYTGWRACTRVPLIIKAPSGTPGLPDGTKAGTRCKQPVGLTSLYSTLTELAGLPAKAGLEEPSILPLLKNPTCDWPNKAVTQLSRPNVYSVSGKRWRYIHYANGDEELYDIEKDPFEWQNLANDDRFEHEKNRLKKHAPTNPVKFVKASPTTLIKLKWNPAGGADVPASKPDGKKLDVHFSNQSGKPVQIFWMDRTGRPNSYGVLEAGWFKPQSTRPGAVWMVMDGKGKEVLGYFEIGDREAQAVIPAK